MSLQRKTCLKPPGILRPGSGKRRRWNCRRCRGGALPAGGQAPAATASSVSGWTPTTTRTGSATRRKSAPMTSQPRAAAIYAWLSSDGSGLGLGVARQLEGCQRAAGTHGPDREEPDVALQAAPAIGRCEGRSGKAAVKSRLRVVHENRDLHPVRDFELGEKTRDVRLDGGLAHEQGCRNLGVGCA